MSYGDNRRWWLAKRDGPNCQACDIELVLVQVSVRLPNGATIDHIRPLSKEGSGQVENLQLMCRECNQGKGDSWDGIAGLKKQSNDEATRAHRQRIAKERRQRHLVITGIKEFQIVPGGSQRRLD